MAQGLDDLAGIMVRPPEEQEWRHNWLYSVLPITNELYLSGYCRNCQRVFSVLIPHDSEPALTKVSQLDIPRWGCVSPKEAGA